MLCCMKNTGSNGFIITTILQCASVTPQLENECIQRHNIWAQTMIYMPCRINDMYFWSVSLFVALSHNKYKNWWTNNLKNISGDKIIDTSNRAIWIWACAKYWGNNCETVRFIFTILPWGCWSESKNSISITFAKRFWCVFVSLLLYYVQLW